MALFGKEKCSLCDKEAGALGRTKLTNKNPKYYVCKSCVKEKVSPYVEAGYLSKESLDRHLNQREKDRELYQEYLADYQIVNIKELASGGNDWTTWYLGKYELRKHRDSNYFCIWENPRGEEVSFDVIHWDEVKGACIWGEYKGKKSDEIVKLPDSTSFTLNTEREYPDKDIKNLYLSLFTSHPFLPTIEIPVIKGGGREDDNKKVRRTAMDLVKLFNKDFVEENQENYVSKKEMKESKKGAKKAIFGALKKGSFDDSATDAVSSLLGNLSKKSQHTSIDLMIAGLRESHDPRKGL